MANPPVSRVSWVLLVVLFAALATGAAASILVSASTTPPPAASPAPLVLLPTWVIVAASAALLAFITAGLVLSRSRGPNTNDVVNRLAISILSATLLGVLVILAGRLVGVGGPVSGNSTAASGGSGPGNTTTGSGGNVTGAGGHFVLFPSLPGWVPFVLLAVVALVVVVVAVPETRRYLAERRTEGRARRIPPRVIPAGVREALTRASAELDQGGDPRKAILSLYGELLGRLRPMVGDIGASTPEEIRVGHLLRLRVRPEAAESLTRLFEEARYSTHPMGPAESARAKTAVRMTVDDLDRREFPE